MYSHCDSLLVSQAIGKLVLRSCLKFVGGEGTVVYWALVEGILYEASGGW